MQIVEQIQRPLKLISTVDSWFAVETISFIAIG